MNALRLGLLAPIAAACISQGARNEPPVATAAASAASVVELEFELVGGRVYVPATVAGRKTSLILDTGAGATVMDLELAKEWELPSVGEAAARGVGGKQERGRILRDVDVEFGGLRTPVGFAFPLGAITEAEGRPLEVIAGFTFFVRHVVEIDYAARRVRVHPRDADLAGPGIVAIPIEFTQNHPHFDARVAAGGAEHEVRAMVDTGASGSGLTARFLARTPLDVKTTPKVVVGGGVGGEVLGRFFRPERVVAGELSFARPILSMTEEKGGASGERSSYDLLVGADLLARTRVVLDYPRKRILFERAADFADPFEAEKTGMRILATKEDLRRYRVAAVMPGSTAEAAGVRVDDRIETIDGKPASELRLHELKTLFRSRDAKGWRLGIRRGEELLEIEVAARPVI